MRGQLIKKLKGLKPVSIERKGERLHLAMSKHWLKVYECSLLIFWQFIYLRFHDQVLWMLKFRYKKYAENFNGINKFQRMGDQSKGQKVLEPVSFEKTEKGGKTTASRVSIYLCCYDQILWMLKFRYKKYAENSNQTNKFQQMDDKKRPTTRRVPLYLCCCGQILWMLNFRDKKYEEMTTKSINSNEWVIDKKFWNPSLLRKL